LSRLLPLRPFCALLGVMAWQTVAKGGKGGDRKRLWALEQEAQSIRTALYGGSGGGGGKQQLKQEWRCRGCSVTNFADREVCRTCREGRAGAKASCPPPPKSTTKAPVPEAGVTQVKLTPGSAWSAPCEGQKPSAKAEALQQSLGWARKAGFSAEVLASMEADVLAAKRAVVEGRSLGERINMASARVKKASKQADTADEAAKSAVAKAEGAKADLLDAEADLKELQAMVAPAPAAVWEPVAATGLAEGSRNLLYALENAPLANCPENVLAAMRALQGSLGCADAAPARLDEAMPCDEDSTTDTGSDAAAYLQELVDADGSLDDAALAAIARRMKRARQA
jgi:hypothetical protein